MPILLTFSLKLYKLVCIIRVNLRGLNLHGNYFICNTDLELVK